MKPLAFRSAPVDHSQLHQPPLLPPSTIATTSPPAHGEKSFAINLNQLTSVNLQDKPPVQNEAFTIIYPHLTFGNESVNIS